MFFQSIPHNCNLPILPARCRKRFQHRRTTRPRLQISALRLKYPPFDPFKVDLRPALPHLRHCEFFKRNLRRLQHLNRSTFESIVRSRNHPQDSAATQKLLFPFPFILGPKLQRPRRHLGIRLIPTVRPPHDPSLSTGRGPRIPRTPSIKQSNPRPAFKQS